MRHAATPFPPHFHTFFIFPKRVSSLLHETQPTGRACPWKTRRRRVVSEHNLSQASSGKSSASELCARSARAPKARTHSQAGLKRRGVCPKLIMAWPLAGKAPSRAQRCLSRRYPLPTPPHILLASATRIVFGRRCSGNNPLATTLPPLPL